MTYTPVEQRKNKDDTYGGLIGGLSSVTKPITDQATRKYTPVSERKNTPKKYTSISDRLKLSQKISTPKDDTYGGLISGLSGITNRLKPSRIDTSKQRDDRSVFESFSEGWQSGVLQTSSAINRILSVGAKKAGKEELSKRLSNIAINDAELSKYAITVRDDRKFKEKWNDPNFISQGVAQNLPNLLFAMGVAAPAAVVGAPALVTGGLAFGTAGSLEAGFAYNDAKEFGVDDEKAEKVAGIVGVANGLLETMPITKLLGRTTIGKSVKRKIIREITKRVVKQAGLESGTESLQEIVQNSVAKVYDKERSSFQGVSDAAFFGGLIGGGTSLVFDSINNEEAKKAVESEAGFAKLPGDIRKIQEGERDAIIEDLKLLTSQDFVNKKGQADVDTFAEKEELLEKFEKNKDTREDILKAHEVLGLYGKKPPSAQKVTGQKPSKFVRKRETTLLKDKIRNLARGAREGTRVTKTQIKKVQNDLIKVIDDSKLELTDKGKFIKAVKNTQTPYQLEKTLPEIEKRIENLENAAQRKKIKSKIQKELKNTKIKKQAGKPVGKFTPEIQNTLDAMRGALKLTQEEAQARIVKNIEKYQKDIPFEVTLENRILSSLSKDSAVKELQNMLDIIQKIKATGRITSELRKFNIEEELARERNLVIDQVTNGKGLQKGKETFIQKDNKFKQSMKSLGKKWVLDWRGLLETLELNTKAGKSKLPQTFSTLDQDNMYKELEIQFTKDFENMIMNAYRIKKRKIHAKLIDLGRDKNLGTFKNADGVSGEIIMTKDELIKRWMELQDPTLRESFIQGNKYTDEIISAIENQLTEQDKAFAQAQFRIYKQQYDKINPIYREVYGINLPFNEFYSPIRRSGFKEDELQGMGEFLVESQERIGLTSGSLISRVNSILPIETQSSIQTLSRHIKETNYFVSYVQQMRRLRSIFSNTSVRDAIKQEFGSQMNTSIGNTLDDMTTRGNRAARRYKPIDYFRKNFTIGALAIKPVIGIKQLVSTVAYMEKLNPVDFTVGVIDFWKNPIKNLKILNEESPLIKTRGEYGNIERDIKAAQQDGIVRRFGKKQSFINLSMLNVRLGDKGAIITGSWALRRKRLKQGVSIKDIVREYEEFSASTQQSADLSRLSEVQRGGSFEQLFTMFRSSPRQYFQKELLAVKSLFQKGGFTPKNLRKVSRVLAVYHIMIPVLFQYIANLGGWDEEDKKEYKRAAILGSLNGLFIFGDVVDMVLRKAMELRVWNNEIVLFEIAKTVNKGLQELDFEYITAEDVMSALSEWSEAGNFIGIPVEQTKNQFSGIKSLMEGNIKRGIALLLGWSPYFADDLETDRLEQYEKRIEKIQNRSKLDEYEKRIKKIQEKASPS